MGIIQPAGANVQHHIANLVIKFERAMSFTYLCIGNLSGFGSFGGNRVVTPFLAFFYNNGL
jgi:hypothetical protein